jgi:hypothetical protein
MNDAQDQSARSIDEIAKDIVNNDRSNGKGRPGKESSRARFLKRPVTWVLFVAIVGIIVAVTLESGSSGKNLAGYVCHGTQVTLFSNYNGDTVANGGSRPTFSTHGQAYCLMYVQTYHWNKGAGSPPGRVGLLQLSGPVALAKYVGSLPTKASAGSNGAANVNWYASVSISKPVILDGTYSCTDSDPSTWSSDKASGGAGFCLVYANLATAPTK